LDHSDWASGEGKRPFSGEAVRALFEHSEGMPREATILADNALLLGFYHQQPTISQETVTEAATDRSGSLAKRGANG
jgi:type II secretory pathway predicted ATPase ExeA